MNLVLTIAVGDAYDRMAKLTHPAIKKYAEKIGAEFQCITESYCSTPHWAKFEIYNLLNKYERILYIDTDILVREDAPNLFDVVPENELGMFNEMPWTENRQISLIDSCKEIGVVLKNWNGKYYNSGVMVIPRSWKFLFKKPKKEFFNFYEQGYLNARIHQELETIGNEMRVFDLPYKFNRMACMDRFTGEERFASYFMHYAGYPNLEFVLGLIKQDLNVWEKNGFHYKRHILVDVQGGLGDQVEAQPAIRYLTEHVYPGDDIVIKTHYPVLFQGIKAKVYLHGQFISKADTPYYHVNTLPGPETSLWHHVSGLLCHQADYSSMALLKRILPAKDKNIILDVKDEWLEGAKNVCGDDLENLVLVHAGKHWESKTMPVEFWQDIVDTLQQEGMKVCLIGKTELTRGTQPIIAREGMIDARDLLSLEELIALLSKAPVLLSNDSAPVHLAGAFDNWIVLVPTCKHPDHVLPFRNGTTAYKTKAIYKRLALDDIPSAPTEVHGSSGQYLNGKWSDYLPETSEIIQEIKECYGNLTTHISA